eukprot:52836-Rhodomonas_salina.1
MPGQGRRVPHLPVHRVLNGTAESAPKRYQTREGSARTGRGDKRRRKGARKRAEEEEERGQKHVRGQRATRVCNGLEFVTVSRVCGSVVVPGRNRRAGLRQRHRWRRRRTCASVTWPSILRPRGSERISDDKCFDGVSETQSVLARGHD